MSDSSLSFRRPLYSSEKDLRNAARELKQRGARLLYAFANDEHKLGVGQFKIYYMFLSREGRRFEFLEYALGKEEKYPSLYDEFPTVDAGEWEIADYFGLLPQNRAVTPGMYLHAEYGDIYPLRREFADQSLRDRLDSVSLESSRGQLGKEKFESDSDTICISGEHKSINEPEKVYVRSQAGRDGHYISKVEFQFGHQARLIEYIGQQEFYLNDVAELAEQIYLPSACSFAAATSRAVEKLPGMRVRLTLAAEIVRELLVRLEVIENLIHYVDDLARSVFFFKGNQSHVSELYQQMLQLNQAIGGGSFLNNLICVGGVNLPSGLDTQLIRKTLQHVIPEFQELAFQLAYDDGFCSRTIGRGRLTLDQTIATGANGIMASSRGLDLDFRNCQPYGIYAHPDGSRLFADATREMEHSTFFPRGRDGDVYSRFLETVTEIRLSANIIKHLIALWGNLPRSQRDCWQEVDLMSSDPYHTSVGYDRGYGGENIVWLMSDKLGRICRIAVCSASFRNLPAVCLSLQGELFENLPLIITSAPFSRAEISK